MFIRRNHIVNPLVVSFGIIALVILAFIPISAFIFWILIICIAAFLIFGVLWCSLVRSRC
jgi:hypothetical protein